jgi:hypothetical protein
MSSFEDYLSFLSNIYYTHYLHPIFFKNFAYFENAIVINKNENKKYRI